MSSDAAALAAAVQSLHARFDGLESRLDALSKAVAPEANAEQSCHDEQVDVDVETMRCLSPTKPLFKSSGNSKESLGESERSERSDGSPHTDLQSSSVLNLYRKTSSFGATAQIALMRYHSEKFPGRKWWILHPEGPWCTRWDVLTSLALIYTALSTPYEVSFVPSPPTWLFVLNRVVDLIFISDMVVSFITMFRVTTQKAIDVDHEWKYAPMEIAKHYLKGWFLLDTFSVASSAFDIIPFVDDMMNSYRVAGGAALFWAGNGPGVIDGSGAGAEGGTTNLKALRIVRTLRLIKLVRLVRASRLLTQWETRIAMPYSAITLCGLFLAVLYVVHLFACALMLQTAFGERLESWLGTFGYCMIASDVRSPVQCVEPAKLYLATVYWALGLVLGYANEPCQGPFEPVFLRSRAWSIDANTWATDSTFTDGETVLNVVLSFWGAILWAYVSARLVEVIVNANPEQLAFRTHLDALNRFCHFHKLPTPMAMKLRAFAHERKLIMRAESNAHVLSTFSPKLQALIAWDSQRGWLSQIRFFNLDSPEDCAYRRRLRIPREMGSMQVIRTRVAQVLKPSLFAPREVVPGRRLYVIVGGYATYCGYPMGEGDSFGSEDVLLSSVYARRRLAFSVNHLHVLSVGPGEIFELTIGFPRQLLEMRLWALKRLLVEALPKRAKHIASLNRPKSSAKGADGGPRPAASSAKHSPPSARPKRQLLPPGHACSPCPACATWWQHRYRSDCPAIEHAAPTPGPTSRSRPKLSSSSYDASLVVGIIEYLLSVVFIRGPSAQYTGYSFLHK